MRDRNQTRQAIIEIVRAYTEANAEVQAAEAALKAAAPQQFEAYDAERRETFALANLWMDSSSAHAEIGGASLGQLEETAFTEVQKAYQRFQSSSTARRAEAELQAAAPREWAAYKTALTKPAKLVEELGRLTGHLT